jgi:hypothetical protein
MTLADFRRGIDANSQRTMALLEELDGVSARMEAGESGPALEADQWRIASAMEANAADLRRLNADWIAARRRQGRRVIAILVAAILAGLLTMIVR